MKDFTVRPVGARFLEIVYLFSVKWQSNRAQAISAFMGHWRGEPLVGATSRDKIDHLICAFWVGREIRFLESSQFSELCDGRVLRAAEAFLKRGGTLELYLVGEAPAAQEFVRKLSRVAGGMLTVGTISQEVAAKFPASLLMVDEKACRIEEDRNSPTSKIWSDDKHGVKTSTMALLLDFIAERSLPYKLAPARKIDLSAFLRRKDGCVPALCSP